MTDRTSSFDGSDSLSTFRDELGRTTNGIDPEVRLNMRIFTALEGMADSRLATTIPFGELRKFAKAFIGDAAQAAAVLSDEVACERMRTGTCSCTAYCGTYLKHAPEGAQQ